MRENPATVYSDSLYSLSGFIDEFSTICFPLKDGKDQKTGKLSKRDMEVLLRWLNRDCGVIITSGEVRLSTSLFASILNSVTLFANVSLWCKVVS
jgi:charged multivesicular body protein 7